MTDKQPSGTPPANHWDDETAAKLIGATVLIGLTYELSNGEVDRQEQCSERLLLPTDRAASLSNWKARD